MAPRADKDHKQKPRKHKEHVVKLLTRGKVGGPGRLPTVPPGGQRVRRAPLCGAPGLLAASC